MNLTAFSAVWCSDLGIWNPEPFMLHLWNCGTKKALGKGRMGAFYSSLLSP